ncbi:MAG: hypothetical protein Q4C47_04140, partial [Planctomycetia bacterium]|nr:hypothetical protein [Planctomycetia bacterium]
TLKVVFSALCIQGISGGQNIVDSTDSGTVGRGRTGRHDVVCQRTGGGGGSSLPWNRPGT